MNDGRWYHFSVDDVLPSLLAAPSPEALPHQPLFAFVARIAEELDTRADLYLFEQCPEGRLDDLPDGLLADFVNRHRVGLGPHARDYGTPPHAQQTAELEQVFARIFTHIRRLAGDDAFSRWLRLHYFSESWEIAPLLHAHGVDTLLLTDKPALAYRLPEARKRDIARHGRCRHAGLDFIRSDLRVEHLAAENLGATALRERLATLLEERGHIVLFSHEIDLMDPAIRELAHECLSILRQLGARSL